MNIRRTFRVELLIIIFIGLLLTHTTAFSNSGRIFNDISIKRNGDYSVITVFFNFPTRYLRHYPLNGGKEVRIQFEPIFLKAEEEEILKKRESIFPPDENPEGVVRVTFESRDIENPSILVTFNEPRNFDAKQGDDFRSLVILIPSENSAIERAQAVSHEPERAIIRETTEDRSPGDNQATELRRLKELSEQREQGLLEEGVLARSEKNYSRAIQVYTRLLDSQKTEVLETAQFQLALAQENIGHFAHAKAEYENYLNSFPNGSNITEAQERLSNLLSSEPGPIADYSRARRAGGRHLKTEFYGSVSTYYDRDENYYEDEEGNVEDEAVIGINSVFTGIDATWRLRSNKYTIETTAIGGFEKDFIPDRDDETRIGALYIDFETDSETVNIRLGRQSSSKGGVLGRFDGARFGYGLLEKVRVNMVAGYPVERSTDGFETGTYFYGLSFDLGSFHDHWNINTYFINQLNDGFNDRQAAGLEIRYIGNRSSLFTLVDYDILFNEVGILLFAGNYRFPNGKTQINLSGDYRNSPILSTTNALIGQAALTLDALMDSLGEAAVHQLARDRSLSSRYITFGLSHSLADNIQLAADMSWSKVDGAPASGGVESFESTGDEYYFSLQLISNNLFKFDDLSTISLRYALTKKRDTATLFIRSRYPIGTHWRVSPKLRIDYRKNTLLIDDQWQYRPGLCLEYILSRTFRFEIEGEYSYADKKLKGLATERKGYAISLGFRWDF